MKLHAKCLTTITKNLLFSKEMKTDIFLVTSRNKLRLQLTEKICSILAVTKSAGWLFGRKVEAIVRKVCFGKRKREVIVVAHIYQRVSENIHGRNHTRLRDSESQKVGGGEEKGDDQTHEKEKSGSHGCNCCSHTDTALPNYITLANI